MNKINFLFVTLFGIGKLKKIPGSYASLVTTIFLFILFHVLNFSPNFVLIGVIIIFLISLFAVNKFIEDLDNKDKSVVSKVVTALKKATKAHSGQAKDLEKAMKTEADQHGDEINQKKLDKVKADKKIADSGSKATKVETEPKVDYKN